MNGAFGRRQNQDYVNLCHYLPSSIWAVLQDPAQPFNAKVEILGKHASTLGLTCPNEQTYAASLTIIHLSSGGSHDSSPAEKHDLLKRFKPVFKKVLERHDKHSVAGLAKLPADFLAAKDHPLVNKALQEGPPMPCPLHQA